MVDVKCVFILMYSIYYSPRMIAFGSFFLSQPTDTNKYKRQYKGSFHFNFA